MIKTWLKHKLLETALNVFFDKLKINVGQPPPIVLKKGRIYNKITTFDENLKIIYERVRVIEIENTYAVILAGSLIRYMIIDDFEILASSTITDGVVHCTLLIDSITEIS